MKIFRWGIIIGPLSIIWYDLWARAIGLEITWDMKVILLVGFKGMR